MKKITLFLLCIISYTLCFELNAQPKVELKNPTQDNTFNTNTTPFNEKKTEGLREEYNTFGNERRNLNVKQGSYDHYNQNGRQQSILSNQDVVINRPQSATLNNNQFNYSDQNNGRKIGNEANSQRVSYNTPTNIEQINRRSLSSSTDDNTIEIGERQNISFDKETGKVEDNVLPVNPYDPPRTEPIGDAVPFVVMLAALYALFIRRKQ